MQDAAAAEQRLLKLSIGVTIAVSLFGVLFGLLSGSLSIVFDGAQRWLTIDFTAGPRWL